MSDESPQNNSGKEIHYLVKNISLGLKRLPADQLSKAVIKAMSHNDKKHEVDFVLESVANHFRITVTALKQKHSRGIIQDAKQIAYCLLHFNLGLTGRYIAAEIFQNWNTSVQTGINRLKNANLDIKSDKDFQDIYLKLQDKLLKFIKEQN